MLTRHLTFSRKGLCRLRTRGGLRGRRRPGQKIAGPSLDPRT